MRIFFTVFILVLLTTAIQAQTFDFLDVNNVKARINSNGDLFWNDSLANGFEVPQGSGKQTIFAGGLWIGGYDNSHNLRLSSQTYRYDRNDFWPGPMGIDTNNFGRWNNVWKVSRIEIDTFVYEFNHGFPNINYVVPVAIQTWPGNGDSASFQDHFLSPFIDLNNDGIYNYLDGDYPCIKGDQAVYFIFNDGANHLQIPVGVEVHAMAYAFQSTDPAINNSIFLNYKIFSKNTTTNIDSAYVGNWTDFDLGNFDDDYIGCDVQRNMYYGYNGDANDEGASGYGLNPPAQGVVFLKGPDADIGDLIDNDRDSCTDCTLYHTSSGDSIVADSISPERIAMSHFLSYYNNNNSIDGLPATDVDFYEYLRGIWRNSSPMSYGGNGHGGGIGGTADPCDFMFPGNSDADHWGTNGLIEPDWDEVTAGIPPRDVRGVASSGVFTIYPGGTTCFDYAYVFARADSGGNFASVDSLKSAVDRVRSFYNSRPELQTCDCTPFSFDGIENVNANISNFVLSPNPAVESCMLEFSLSEKSKLEIEICDVSGRVLKHFSPRPVIGRNRIELKLQGIADGLYFIRIKTGDQVVSKKLVVNKR